MNAIAIFQNCRQLLVKGALFSTTLLLSGGTHGAPSPSVTCMNNQQEVVVRGIASAQYPNLGSNGQTVVWILSTEKPLCINVSIAGDAIVKSQTYANKIQIFGATPPIGVPIELKGTLKVGNNVGNSADSNAVPISITVSSGTKIRKNADEVVDVPAPTPTPTPAEITHRDDAKIKPRKVASRVREPEVKPPPIPKTVTDALQKAKQMALLYKVDSLEIELDDTPGASGYSIYLHYNTAVFTEHRTGHEAVIVFDNNYNLAREFVKQLVNTDQDPVNKANPKYVNVCSEVDDVNPVTKKPEFELLGCARYSPQKDMIDPDFTRISERLAAPK